MSRRPRLTRTLAALLTLAVAACGDVGRIAGPSREVHPGFDTSIYPGDDAMRAWLYPRSPYRWVGYYLPAPCHRDTTWMGTLPRLRAMGWGVAVLYVGQQTWDHLPAMYARHGVRQEVELSPAERSDVTLAGTAPRCSRTLLTTEQGVLEADDAVARAAAEGFPRGTAVFLDLEYMESVSPAMQAYFRAWIARMLVRDVYRPAVYAHDRNAAQLHAIAREVYAAAGRSGAPDFWVAGGTGFSLSAHPTSVGHAFATVWQGRLDISERWNGLTLYIDVNVATTRAPSDPD